MGLFDFLKRNRVAAADQALVDKVSDYLRQVAESPLPEPLSPQAYNEVRAAEVAWFEKHYDFNSIEGINSIPVSNNLPHPLGGRVTGEVYYYLRSKAFQHEKAGNIDLAIACLRKSVALMQLKYGALHGRDECYSLIGMLARYGYTEEAVAEKVAVDRFYDLGSRQADKDRFRRVCKEAAATGTDLLIMSAHGAACPECAKYQGRVYSISGKNKLFPKIPAAIASIGCVHPGCGHAFSPYIHKVSNPDLKYTLSVHPLKRKRYGWNIVAFSNRPFVDDRTEECKQAAAVAQEKAAAERERKLAYQNQIIEIETRRRQEALDFEWLQHNIPQKCPKSLTGYRRMKTQNTKNYQLLKTLALDLGREI